MSPIPILLALPLLAGCASRYYQVQYGAEPQALVGVEALQRLNGACAVAEMSFGSGIAAVSCLQVGIPGSPQDDFRTPHLRTTFWSPDIELASPSAYRVEVRADGVPILQGAGGPEADGVPPDAVPGSSGPRYRRTSLLVLPRLPVAGEVWEIAWMANWDSGLAATATIRFQ